MCRRAIDLPPLMPQLAERRVACIKCAPQSTFAILLALYGSMCWTNCNFVLIWAFGLKTVAGHLRGYTCKLLPHGQAQGFLYPMQNLRSMPHYGRAVMIKRWTGTSIRLMRQNNPRFPYINAKTSKQATKIAAKRAASLVHNVHNTANFSTNAQDSMPKNANEIKINMLPPCICF